MNIAIIGGGLTGMTAAYELSKKGYKVTIFEAGDELGGLASGFKIHGNYLEKTYHHLFRTDKEIISLVKELGLEDKLIWPKSSMSIYYDQKFFSFGKAIHLLKFTPVSFIDRIRTGLTMLYLKHFRNWQQFENISAFEWMQKRVGKSSMDVIWEPLLKGKFSENYKKIAMSWLWARIHIRANSRKSGETDEVLGYFDGGFNVLVRGLENRLINARQVSMVKSTKIKKIEGLKTGKIKVSAESRESEIFDKVIATVPSYIFGEMIANNESITESYIDKLNSIDYLGAITLVFSSDQDMGEAYWNNINDLSKPFLVFLNHTKLIDKSKYDGKYIYYLGTYLPHENEEFRMVDDELVQKWFDALREILPKFDESRVIEKHLFKFSNAQHVVDTGYKNKIPDYKTPIENVYLANFSQIYPEDRGTNYAVRDGKKIADLF